MFDLNFHRKFNDILYLLLQPTKYIYLNPHQTEVDKRNNNDVERRLLSFTPAYTIEETKYVYDFAISIGLKPKRSELYFLAVENIA